MELNTIETAIESQEFTLDQIRWAGCEVARQGDGPVYVTYMIKALGYARLIGQHTIINTTMVVNLASLVLNRHNPYRNTNVTFWQGVSVAVSHEHVERQMSLLLDNQQHMNPDEFVYRFLEIHPFEDGNGRTGALLYNIKMGTVDNPIIMPDYFGG